jgi:hypothetical protein
MGKIEDMSKLTEEIISSYESRIFTVGSIVDDAHQVIDDFRAKRNIMSSKLKETLAQEGSLRKKDFDNMMKDLFSIQEEREKAVRDLLKTYLEEQKETAKTIRENFKKNETARIAGEKIRGNDFRKMLEDIRTKQTSRESEVCEMLKEFRKEHKETSESFRNLLSKEKAVRVKDVKMMLKNVNAKRREVKEEINEAASQWRELTGVMSEKKAERRVKAVTGV